MVSGTCWMLGVLLLAQCDSFENPFFSISGTSIFASMAASARFEPESPTMRVDSSTFTCARPPGRRPVMAEQKFMIRVVTPE